MADNQQTPDALSAWVASFPGGHKDAASLLAHASQLRERITALESLEEKVNLVLADPTFFAIQARSEILALLRRACAGEPRFLCEIGAAHGGTLLLLSQVAAPDARLLSIDLYHTPLSMAICGLFAREQQRVTCFRGDSQQRVTNWLAGEWLGNNRLDLLFIDGDHSLVGVSTDFARYAPLVRNGGLIALHDIVPDSFTRRGVRTTACTGDVPLFWRTLKATQPGLDTLEIIDNPDQDGLGIGLINVGSRPITTTTSFARASKIVRADSDVFAPEDGQSPPRHLDAGSYYGFDPIASHIWELLAQPTTVADLCARLGEEYEIDDETCRQDVIGLLGELLGEELIRAV